jgi:hypothetical protein
MVGVGLVALNLAAIRALADGFQEQLLFDALPTLNLLVFTAIVGCNRRRLRPYALGFVVVGSSSLLAYQVWAENHPWEWLRYFQPLSDIAVHIRDAYPQSYMPIVYTMLIIVFAIPHSIAGVVGGCLTAKGWAIIARRRQG